MCVVTSAGSSFPKSQQSMVTLIVILSGLHMCLKGWGDWSNRLTHAVKCVPRWVWFAWFGRASDAQLSHPQDKLTGNLFLGGGGARQSKVAAEFGGGSLLRCELSIAGQRACFVAIIHLCCQPCSPKLAKRFSMLRWRLHLLLRLPLRDLLPTQRSKRLVRVSFRCQCQSLPPSHSEGTALNAPRRCSSATR